MEAGTETSTPFAKESRELFKALVRGQSHIVYSKPEPEDQHGRDYDSAGHLDTLLLDRLGLARNADFYLCGPPSFLRNFTEGLRTWGARPNASSLGDLRAGGIDDSRHRAGCPTSSAPPLGNSGAGPQISFTRSGLTVPWDPRFIGLLELAEACDVPVKWSCRTGVCHSCECPLIGGAVAYRPAPLELPADGNALICCSQPSSDIEIDL